MGVNYLNSNHSADQLEILLPNWEQATGLIIERARQLVNQLIEDRGHDKPPFLPVEFARLCGVKRIEKADLGSTSAVLLRFHDGFVIKVNENHNLARQNFSCAHEIGHTVFGELELEPYIQRIEYRTFNPQARDRIRAAARERLCDAAATELLMPEAVFKKYLSGYGTSIYSVERLANIFRVSIQTVAIRIAELSEERCIAIMWQLWKKARSKVLRVAWRVGPGGEKQGRSRYMPVHTLVKYSEKLYQAHEGDTPVKSSKLFRLDSDTKRCPVESKGFGRDETRYVISLAFPDR